MRNIQSACLILAFLFGPAPLFAQPVTLDLAPGQAVRVTCAGDWANLITSPDLTADCVEPEPPEPGTGFVIDHTSVALFDQIPPAYLAAARDLRVLFRTASVGQNISGGLNCLVNNSPNFCRAGYTVPAPQIPIVSRPQYDRTRWLLEARGNPGWYGKVTDFITQVETRSASFDAMMWKQSYVDDPSIINFWTRAGTGPDIGDVEQALATHPSTRAVFWTAAIAKTPVNMQHIATFNGTMRLYATENNAVLFDVADIESHRPDGSLCSTGGLPTICAEYSVETSGGHLTNGMAQQRLAQAFWVLVARLAGWQP